MALLATAGGIMHLNRSLPGGEFISKVVSPQVSRARQILDDIVIPAEEWVDEPEAGKPEEVKPESTAQKRARFAPLVTAAAFASKVEPALIEAIMTAESAFNPMAVSKTGAVGLMQLMPDTAQRYGVTDRLDPAQNILGGAKYLYFLLHKFGNQKLAIAAYNAGEGSVKKHGNKIPPFSETRTYVPRVLAYYKQYRSRA
jgi:soluble lytic murein transglycosylase-like protein